MIVLATSIKRIDDSVAPEKGHWINSATPLKPPSSSTAAVVASSCDLNSNDWLSIRAFKSQKAPASASHFGAGARIVDIDSRLGDCIGGRSERPSVIADRSHCCWARTEAFLYHLLQESAITRVSGVYCRESGACSNHRRCRSDLKRTLQMAAFHTRGNSTFAPTMTVSLALGSPLQSRRLYAFDNGYFVSYNTG